MRLFFAIELPEPIRVQVAGVQEMLRAKIPEHVSWVRPEQFHITLRYIRECSEVQAETLIEDVKRRLFPPPLALTLVEVMPMPARRGGRPIAVSAWEGTGDLNWVRTTCDDMTRLMGLPEEGERFAPHVTLGHIRPIQRVTARELDDYLEGRRVETKFVAHSITLFRSELSPNASTFVPLGRLNLPTVQPPAHGEWVSGDPIR